MPGGASCANVHGQAQGVPAGDARTLQPLVEDVEAADRADPLGRRAQGGEGLGKQFGTAGGGLAPGRVERQGQQ